MQYDTYYYYYYSIIQFNWSMAEMIYDSTLMRYSFIYHYYIITVFP